MKEPHYVNETFKREFGSTSRYACLALQTGTQKNGGVKTLLVFPGIFPSQTEFFFKWPKKIQ